jgi:nicotinamidase-related amidase
MNRCLLVIDMQEDFMIDKSKEDLEAKLRVQSNILERYRSEDIPVIYTRFSRYGDIVKEIQPRSQTEVIVKNCSDGFYDAERQTGNTELRRRLAQYNRLDVIGCNAEVCVSLTIDSALKLGHKVRAYENALLSRNSSRYALFSFKLKYFFRRGIEVVRFD